MSLAGPSVLTAPQRNFGNLAMFGFASTLLCTWETMAMYVPSPTTLKKEPSGRLLTPFSRTIGVALPNGGTAGLFWNYIIAAVGLGFVYASIAELGSMSVYNPQNQPYPSPNSFANCLLPLPIGFLPLVASITGLLF
jgi:hypothetical protein